MVHFHLVGWGWLSWYERFLWSINWDTQIANLWSSELWCEAHISWGWADHWSRPVQPLRFSRTLVFAPHASVLVGRHTEQETPSKAMGHTSWTYWIQLMIARTCKNWLVEMEPEMKWWNEIGFICRCMSRDAAWRDSVIFGLIDMVRQPVGSPNSMYGNSCIYNVWALEMYIITAINCLKNILYMRCTSTPIYYIHTRHTI